MKLGGKNIPTSWIHMTDITGTESALFGRAGGGVNSEKFEKMRYILTYEGVTWLLMKFDV